MVDEIVSLISLSDLLLLAHKNARYSCILILYPETLLNSSISFLVASLGLTYSIMSSESSDSFTSFPIWIPFISFSSLITMARTSKTMLNNSVKRGHSCLAPDLRVNAFSFSPLKIIFAIGLSYMTFIILCAHFLERVFWFFVFCLFFCFTINGCWILSKAFL